MKRRRAARGISVPHVRNGWKADASLRPKPNLHLAVMFSCVALSELFALRVEIAQGNAQLIRAEAFRHSHNHANSVVPVEQRTSKCVGNFDWESSGTAHEAALLPNHTLAHRVATEAPSLPGRPVFLPL